MGRLLYLHCQSLLTWLNHLGGIFIFRRCQVICGKYTQMKVVVCTILTLWGGMWTWRSICTLQRRKNVWWVGDASSVWWIFSDQRKKGAVARKWNGSIKLYLWRRVQVCSLWSKEIFQQHSFRRLKGDWGEIGERLGSDREQAIKK